MCSQEYCFSVYFPNCTSTREINTKITLKRAHKHLVMRVYNTLFLTRHNKSINDVKKRWSSHMIPVSCSVYVLLMTLYYNRLLMMSQWPDNCDVSTCIIISQWYSRSVMEEIQCSSLGHRWYTSVSKVLKALHPKAMPHLKCSNLEETSAKSFCISSIKLLMLSHDSSDSDVISLHYWQPMINW